MVLQNPGAQSSRYLLPTSEEEFVGIDAICDGTSKERYPMEYNRRLVRALEKQLAKDVENNRYDKEREGACKDNDPDGFTRNHIAQRPSDGCEETHNYRE